MARLFTGCIILMMCIASLSGQSVAQNAQERAREKAKTTPPQMRIELYSLAIRLRSCPMADGKGLLKDELSNDGLHPNSRGYQDGSACRKSNNLSS
jgi:lysophospholipase L1-like esterase